MSSSFRKKKLERKKNEIRIRKKNRFDVVVLFFFSMLLTEPILTVCNLLVGNTRIRFFFSPTPSIFSFPWNVNWWRKINKNKDSYHWLISASAMIEPILHLCHCFLYRHVYTIILSFKNSLFLFFFFSHSVRFFLLQHCIFSYKK